LFTIWPQGINSWWIIPHNQKTQPASL
jgi:hypothetical protein